MEGLPARQCPRHAGISTEVRQLYSNRCTEYATSLIIYRSYASCGIPKSEFSPHLLLDHISKDTPPSLRARIFSFLAHVHFDIAQNERALGKANTTTLYRAADMGNRAAALAFVSPIVLLIANHIEGTGLRVAVAPLAGEGVDATSFEEFVDLWKVQDRRKWEVSVEEEKRSRKVQREPHAYICAVKECGIMGTHKNGLMRCAGKCPRACKPAYCGKSCQLKVGLIIICVGFY